MYFRYDDALYLSDRVILYQDRVVVVVVVYGSSCVLNKVNSAHKGVTYAKLCQQIVFWPGIMQDIEGIWT